MMNKGTRLDHLDKDDHPTPTELNYRFLDLEFFCKYLRVHEEFRHKIWSHAWFGHFKEFNGSDHDCGAHLHRKTAKTIKNKKNTQTGFKGHEKIVYSDGGYIQQFQVSFKYLTICDEL